MTVCVCGEGGVWELTLVLNDLIERHPPAPLHLLPPSERTAAAAQQRAEGPPSPPPRQFAVWVAQRRGQRSNKCSEKELLSHGNALTNKSASFQESETHRMEAFYKYDSKYKD